MIFNFTIILDTSFTEVPKRAGQCIGNNYLRDKYEYDTIWFTIVVKDNCKYVTKYMFFDGMKIKMTNIR